MPLSFFKKNRLDLLLLGFLTLTAPLFFYKLGQSSLVSWDEAWYAEIARNILKSGNIFNLVWNGQPYVDHPPAGFWLIALGEKLFGMNEFGVRVSSAIFGLLSLYITYLLGKELFNRTVGFVSALALSSAFWFLYRARSGNLDVFLAMFFILTLLLALKSIKNRLYFIPLGISLALLFLTKTLVPLTILPSLGIIFLGLKIKKKDLPYYLISVGIFLLVIIAWFQSEAKYKSDFVSRYFMIGLPGVEAKSSYLDNLRLAKEYLHNGIGKWFWPAVASIILGFFLLQKRFLTLSVFFITFFVPFLFSSKGHIWHLIPLYPVMIISFFGMAYFLLTLSLRKTSVVSEGRKQLLINGLLIGVCLYFFIPQIRQEWYQFIDIPRFISDEAILSSEAGKYEGKFFIDGDFGPTAVWYSGKNVQQARNEATAALFKAEDNFSNQNSFILITKQYRLDELNIPKSRYDVLKKDRDRILVLEKK